MRKALTLVLLAATTALSAPAAAQDWGAEGVAADRASERENRREQRQQMREERQERREERRQERADPPATSVGVATDVALQRNRPPREDRPDRGERSNRVAPWGGDPNDPARERIMERYERLRQDNAIRYGTPEQRREALQDRREDRRDDRRDWRQDRREDRQEWRQDRRDDRRDWRWDRRDDRREWRQDWRDWNRDWRRDQRYDWRSYRNYNRHIFRARPYYSPYRNYGYTRFSIGVILDRLFWGRNYWISDPFTYRLPPAPAGYVWVRYYNDVLLIDTWDGRVVDVIYDFFW